MLTLAFAQIVWAVCFKWNSVTGGEQGLSNVPYPDLTWLEAALHRPVSVGEQYYLLALVLVARASRCCRGSSARRSAACSTLIRENPERAGFVGVNVRRYELGAFALAGHSPAWPAHCSGCSTGACSPTSPTGRSRRRS